MENNEDKNANKLRQLIKYLIVLLRTKDVTHFYCISLFLRILGGLILPVTPTPEPKHKPLTLFRI